MTYNKTVRAMFRAIQQRHDDNNAELNKLANNHPRNVQRFRCLSWETIDEVAEHNNGIHVHCVREYSCVIPNCPCMKTWK